MTARHATAAKRLLYPALFLGLGATLASACNEPARLGHDVRAGFDKHVPDPVVALAEDGVAIGLAVAGAAR